MSEDKDLISQVEEQKKKPAAGWYDHAGGKRFYDGAEWTDHYAYVPPPVTHRSTWDLAGAVFIGVLAAFFVLWLLAQLDPDNAYLPVKFVVDASDLPSGFR